MLTDATLRELVREIHRCPPLAGCMIGYQGNRSSRILAGRSRGSPGAACIVIIEEVVTDDPGLSSELELFSRQPHGSPAGQPNPSIVTNRGRIGPELAGAGISCGLTVVSAVGVLAGVAGEVPTGGASTFLVVASWVSLTAGGVQCVNAVVRAAQIFRDPDGDSLQRWDDNPWYSGGILLVDGLGVVSGVGALPFAAKNLWAVLARQRRFLAKGLSFESLRAMNRAERLRAMSEVFEEAARTPEGRAALLASAREAQVGAQALQRSAGLSVRHAERLRKVIGDETARRLSASLTDIIVNTAGAAASATPAWLTGSASGSVNYVIHLVSGEPG